MLQAGEASEAPSFPVSHPQQNSFERKAETERTTERKVIDDDDEVNSPFI